MNYSSEELEREGGMCGQWIVDHISLENGLKLLIIIPFSTAANVRACEKSGPGKEIWGSTGNLPTETIHGDSRLGVVHLICNSSSIIFSYICICFANTIIIIAILLKC